MLHLQPYNILIQKTLNEALDAYTRNSPLTIDRIISDFDYTTYHVSNSPEDKSIIYLSINTKAWSSISKYGSDLLEYLSSKYDSLVGVSILFPSEAGYDFSLQVKLNSLDSASILKISLLKVIIISYAFHLSFNEHLKLSHLPEGSQESTNIHLIQYRDNENIYIKPSGDRITVIFETIFQDETDKIFGKVFIQEFVDARKRNRSIQSAPQVLFSQDPPLELSNLSSHTLKSFDKSKRFITFVLFPRHFSTPELQFSTVCHLSLFRNYFHYHIKCSKAYMHSRMRFRVDSFIKVLNRAKLDEDEEGYDETRRTITGRKIVYR